LDVHQESVTACVLWAEGKGKKRKEKRPFGTMTRDLLALADWLRACGVTQVAMESTGVYWKGTYIDNSHAAVNKANKVLDSLKGVRYYMYVKAKENQRDGGH